MGIIAATLAKLSDLKPRQPVATARVPQAGQELGPDESAAARLMKTGGRLVKHARQILSAKVGRSDQCLRKMAVRQ